MYNPSRGGVRGGADQFTWESVKGDKHRENYLGHSLMAPVGRWQKGKDLSWYAKERKDAGAPEKSEKSELASIKRAEEEAMLIALGHNVVRKTQTLSKEDMREALKRNSDRDDYQIERVNGVGASSQRAAMLSGVGKDPRQKSEGVAFESHRDKITSNPADGSDEERSVHHQEKKKKKKSKKHKKEKKHRKHKKESYDSDSSNSSSQYGTKNKRNESESDDREAARVKSHKKSKSRHKDYSCEGSVKKQNSNSYPGSHKRHKKQSDSVKRQRHDSSSASD